MLALVYGLSKFEHILGAQRFLVRTDNMAVANFASAKINVAVKARWLDTLARFSFDCMHISGKELIPADTLSRLLFGNPDERLTDDRTESFVEYAAAGVNQLVPVSDCVMSSVSAKGENPLRQEGVASHHTALRQEGCLLYTSPSPRD